MNSFIIKKWKYLVFTAAGALAGFMYWRFVGCRSGTCPLTANWHTSVLLGGLVGLMAVPQKKTGSKPGNDKEKSD